MTAFGVAGCLLFLRGRRTAAFACLYLYAMMGLLVVGHYLIAPPWQVSFKINLFILAEAIAASLLGVVTAWLQFRREGIRPSVQECEAFLHHPRVKPNESTN
jgi:hypothetical protein